MLFQIFVGFERLWAEFAFDVADVSCGYVLTAAIARIIRIRIAVLEELLTRLGNHGCIFLLL